MSFFNTKTFWAEKRWQNRTVLANNNNNKKKNNTSLYQIMMTSNIYLHFTSESSALQL